MIASLLHVQKNQVMQKELENYCKSIKKGLCNAKRARKCYSKTQL